MNNEFVYQATLSTPTQEHPSNWLHEINLLETWLNQHLGIHMQDWAYIGTQNGFTIGFKKPEHKTFFLIYYDK